MHTTKGAMGGWRPSRGAVAALLATTATLWMYLSQAVHASFVELYGAKEAAVGPAAAGVATLLGVGLGGAALSVVGLVSGRPRARAALVSSMCLLLLVAVCLHYIRFGTMTFLSSCSLPAPAIEFYYMTIPRNANRVASLEAGLKRAGVTVRRVVRGIDARDYRTTTELIRANGVGGTFAPPDVVPPPEYRSYVAVTLAVQRALELMTNVSDDATVWCVLFEDDAVLFPHFSEYLARATCEYADYDMIWLDTRNAPNWFFLRRLDGGSNAVAYRRSSLRAIAAQLDYHSPMMIRERTRPGAFSTNRDAFFALGIDVSLARLCNTGVMRCASVPLVVESGAQKTTGVDVGASTSAAAASFAGR